MELILFPSGKSLRGLLKKEGLEIPLTCWKKKEKTKSGANVFVCYDESKDYIGVVVVGEPKETIRIGSATGKVVGKAYIDDVSMDLGEFKSKKGKVYYKAVEI